MVCIRLLEKWVLYGQFCMEFLNSSNSLLYRIMDAKYGGCSRQLNESRGSSSSWKILCDGVKSNAPIIRCKVGGGDSSNVLKDVWVLDRSFNKWPTFFADSINSHMIVVKFIMDGIWNKDELNKFFGEQFVLLICQIQIILELDKN